MKNVIIAPVGDNMDALFVGIREFPTEKIILLAPSERLKDAERARADLERFKIPTRIIEIKGNIWEEIFKKMNEIASIENSHNLLVNTATGDRMTTCAATSAAFVNGIKAFSVDKGEAMMLPVLKFSYYKMLSDKKMKLLGILNKPDCCLSLEMLSKKAKMSLPLVSYHINGNLKAEGLKQMGLAETVHEKGRIAIKLTTLGRLILQGYVSS